MLTRFRKLGRLDIRAESAFLACALTVALWAAASFVSGFGYDKPWPLPGRPIQPLGAALISILVVGIASLKGGRRMLPLSLVCSGLVLGAVGILVANRLHVGGLTWLWPWISFPDHDMRVTGNPSIPASNWNAAAFASLAAGTILSTLRSRAARLGADILSWVPISIGVAIVSGQALGFSELYWSREEAMPSYDLAFALCCLGFGLGLANDRFGDGAFSTFRSKDTAGGLMRRYLAVVLLVPVAAIWGASEFVRILDSIAILPVALPVLLIMMGGVSAISISSRVRTAERGIREAKTRAEEAKECLSLALEAGNIGTWESDVGTQQVWRSDVLYRMYGLEKREPEISSQHWRAMVHPEDKSWVFAARDALGPLQPEYRRTHRVIRASDGVIRYVTVAARWLPGGPTGAGRIVGAVSDITPHMEAALAAERANQAKSMLIAGIGHDLRQPLQGLLLHLDVVSGLLRGNSSVPAATQTSLDACADATVSLSKMLDGMLAMARSGTDQEPLRLHDMSVAHLLRDLGREYTPRAAVDQITLRVRVPVRSDMLARTDPVLLERIIRNLIENAIKHTPKGGRILVAGRAREKGPLIEVRDSGRGIPAAALNAIWDDQRQISPSDHGSGMGLATVRRLAIRMGCAFGADSAPGRGSRFWIRVPIREDASEPAPAKRLSYVQEAGTETLPLPVRFAPASGAHKPLVLLVEDEVPVRQGLAGLLARLGTETVEADDFRSACSAAQALMACGRAPNAILSDYRLPNESGIKVIKAVRSLFRIPIPAALLTAETGDEVEGEAAAIGAWLLRKPLGAEQIEEAMRSMNFPFEERSEGETAADRLDRLPGVSRPLPATPAGQETHPSERVFNNAESEPPSPSGGHKSWPGRASP